MIKHYLNRRLSGHKGAWANELSSVLLAYRITPHNAIREIPYFLTFKVEVIIFVEVGLSNHCTAHFSYEQNDNNLRAKVNLLKER